ncbi:Flavin-binding monooxygenase-like family protein [Candida parapsilosis]|uniref:Thiol-specific monooxygenase n=2 Tax=Candida parapsilosis TaxID=5480 RepID=G8B7M3_CANPC|nr:uncharacterized protein CPAR2_104940 [Candida parapsilosis]KAF6048448.1 Flavin-binding monooxygenase-like family protein [Candida parapsilosis]KAF6049596.1 Flavin-binding monooxygenase-like family protein [Candida parapsilosis]KAF6057447.1 Flavin-binding monooxygenase-like family protein [Candida parapsilosis]KAF6065834.1 Flavin-binding monooxygenase-like family protein [Candida parapsilosis]KAI5902835.1 Flavin-containing monooxygenase FMO GS-OX-like 6 [Candida parapsilosis]
MPSISNLNYEVPVSVSPSQIETIAIIGGGASGAIILDSLLKEPNSRIKSITIFERQQKVGGIWYFNPQTIPTPNHIVKAGNINFQNDPQLNNPFHVHKYTRKLILPKNTQERFIQTPSYHGIKTNIIEKMMTYSDKNKWPVEGADEERKYVAGTVVQEYIEEYIGRNLYDPRVNLKLGSTVEDVERIDRNDDAPIPYKFRLTIREQYDDKQDYWYQKEFDSIVVATGHYHVPFIPGVSGLRELQEKHPNVVQHAKFYRSSDSYKDKTVVVVGSRASGSDLTKFVAREPGTKVYQSIRNIDRTKVFSNKPNVTTKPVIENIELSKNNIVVRFADGSVVTNPDHIIYCTGYLFSYPFLDRLFDKSLTNDGITVSNLYQHTFIINEPLITIIGVPVDGVSFRVFEYQAILLSRYLTGKIELISRNKQLEWVKQRYELKGNSRLFHTIGVTDALEYAKTLTQLGHVSEKVRVGRQFPSMTDDDIAVYKEAGEKLRKFWDER